MPPEPAPEKDYACVKPCGCVVAITANIQRHKNEIAKEIAQWVRDGYAVELLPRQECVDRFLAFVDGGCPHEDRQLSLI